jgi:hypothetical protein
MSSLQGWTRLVGFLALVTAPFVILVALVLVLDNGVGGAGTRVEQSPVVPTYTMTVVLGRNVAFVPNNLTIPADTTVRIRIENYDDATPASGLWSKVRGTVNGTISVQTFKPTAPNVLGKAQVVGSLNPKTEISHTFTSGGLGLNIPLAPDSVTTFVFQTGKPGRYYWRCYDPCGSGANGEGGIMRWPRYMSGTITVA